MKPTLLATLCAATCVVAVSNAVLAQGSDSSIAALKSVVGNVLVSKDTGLATGSDDTRLTRGARVLTTTSSEAVVKYDNGCEVRLKPNQRFEVDSDKSCEALIAQVESIVTEPVGALAVGTDYIVPVGAIGVTLLIIQSERQRSSVSPN